MATTDDLAAISGKEVMTKTKLYPKRQARSAAHRLGTSPAKTGMLDDVPRPFVPRDDSEAAR